jgi:hypothetical protein
MTPKLDLLVKLGFLAAMIAGLLAFASVIHAEPETLPLVKQPTPELMPVTVTALYTSEGELVGIIQMDLLARRGRPQHRQNMNWRERVADHFSDNWKWWVGIPATAAAGYAVYDKNFRGGRQTVNITFANDGDAIYGDGNTAGRNDNSRRE